MKEFNFDIWRLQAQSDVRGLLDALKNPNPSLRQRAAMALRVMGSPSALPALQDALLKEIDKETRDIIIATLEILFTQEHDNDSAPSRAGSQVVEFISRLNSVNTEHAVRAAQGLGEIQEKLAVEALMVTFNNRNLSARVRLAAAEALIRLQSPTADIALLAALRSERWSVRRSAAAVLGQMDADWAVEPLIKALQDPYEVVRRTARAALEHIGTPEAIHAIEAVGDLAIEPPSMGEITSASKPAPTPERTSPATSEVTSLSTGVESAGHAITSTLPSGIEADLSPGPAQKTVAPGENNPSPPLQQKPASSDFSLNLASVSSATITGESSVHSSVGTISEEKVANTEPAHDLNTVTRAVPGNAAQSEIASTVPIVIESPSAADSQSHDTEEDTRPMTPIPDDVS